MPGQHYYLWHGVLCNEKALNWYENCMCLNNSVDLKLYVWYSAIDMFKLYKDLSPAANYMVCHSRVANQESTFINY